MRSPFILLGIILLAGGACVPRLPVVLFQPPSTATAPPPTITSAPPTPPRTPAVSPSSTVRPSSPTAVATTSPRPSATTTVVNRPSATATRAASGAPAASDLLFPVARDRALSASYVPPDLTPIDTAARTVRGAHQVRQVVLADLARMVKDMQTAGLNPVVSSAYRSYAEQESTYAYWVQTLGAAQADRVSAKPGHSEHQLGLALDFASAENGYELEESFATTKEGKWLFANAARYGFVMSYPAGKEAVTGYAYEPWHFRYVGAAHAEAIARSDQTPIEYYRTHSR
ncbi:MAG: M15 family metallopeptidase [Dehalococcoidia bacterium]